MAVADARGRTRPERDARPWKLRTQPPREFARSWRTDRLRDRACARRSELVTDLRGPRGSPGVVFTLRRSSIGPRRAARSSTRHEAEQAAADRREIEAAPLRGSPAQPATTRPVSGIVTATAAGSSSGRKKRTERSAESATPMGSGTKWTAARGRPKPPDRTLPPPGSGRLAQSAPSHHKVRPSASADHVFRPLSGKRARRTSSTRDFRLPRRRHVLPPFTDSKTPSFVAARNRLRRPTRTRAFRRRALS